MYIYTYTYMHTYIHIYIYIYIEREREREREKHKRASPPGTRRSAAEKSPGVYGLVAPNMNKQVSHVGIRL